MRAYCHVSLWRELLIQDALFEIVLWIEEQVNGYIMLFRNGNAAYFAHLRVIGDRADRALSAVENFEAHLGTVRQ